VPNCHAPTVVGVAASRLMAFAKSLCDLENRVIAAEARRGHSLYDRLVGLETISTNGLVREMHPLDVLLGS
jgi:hypothetical protein